MQINVQCAIKNDDCFGLPIGSNVFEAHHERYIVLLNSNFREKLCQEEDRSEHFYH